MVDWEIKSKLAMSSRPGYGKRNPSRFVEDWIDEVKRQGIKSILCLLADQHLSMYTDLPAQSLLETYRQNGLFVRHVPVEDHKEPPVSESELAQIWKVFQALPQPVLVHCSAGIDRTGAVVKYLCEKLEAHL